MTSINQDIDLKCLNCNKYFDSNNDVTMNMKRYEHHLIHNHYCQFCKYCVSDHNSHCKNCGKCHNEYNCTKNKDSKLNKVEIEHTCTKCKLVFNDTLTFIDHKEKVYCHVCNRCNRYIHTHNDIINDSYHKEQLAKYNKINKHAFIASTISLLLDCKYEYYNDKYNVADLSDCISEIFDKYYYLSIDELLFIIKSNHEVIKICNTIKLGNMSFIKQICLSFCKLC
jgi:hypothetical protein